MNIQKVERLKELTNKLEGLHRQKQLLKEVKKVTFQNDTGQTIMSLRKDDAKDYLDHMEAVTDDFIEYAAMCIKQEFGINLGE